MKYVNVEFLSTKDKEQTDIYVYKDNLNTKINDYVLVDTKYGVTLGKVVSIGSNSILAGSIEKEVLEILNINYLKGDAVKYYTPQIKVFIDDIMAVNHFLETIGNRLIEIKTDIVNNTRQVITVVYEKERVV